MKSRRITFFGNFGAGNLGNECTLQAIIEQTLKRWPQATLQCVCAVPEDAELRHNIRAFHFEAMKTKATGRVATLSALNCTAGIAIVMERSVRGGSGEFCHDPD